MAPPVRLVAGAVRGWHIALLYVLIFLSMAVVSGKLARAIQPDAREAWKLFAMQALTASLVVLVTLVVPELRRSLRDLYLHPRSAMTGADVLLFATLMIAWAFGAHRLLVVYPLLHWNPSLAPGFGLAEHVQRPGGVAGLFILVAVAFIAPLAEELLFRGYFLNLWRHRWGTWGGIALSSLLFGSAHFQVAAFAALAGVFLCLVYLRFGSLWPGTLLHSLHNVIAGPFGLAPFFLEKQPAEVLDLSAWIPEIALTVAFFPLLFLFWRRFRPAS